MDLREDARHWCYNCDPKAPPELAADRRRLRAKLMDIEKRIKRRSKAMFFRPQQGE